MSKAPEEEKATHSSSSLSPAERQELMRFYQKKLSERGEIVPTSILPAHIDYGAGFESRATEFACDDNIRSVDLCGNLICDRQRKLLDKSIAELKKNKFSNKCVRCGGYISLIRLKFVPGTKVCRHCA